MGPCFLLMYLRGPCLGPGAWAVDTQRHPCSGASPVAQGACGKMKVGIISDFHGWGMSSGCSKLSLMLDMRLPRHSVGAQRAQATSLDRGTRDAGSP